MKRDPALDFLLRGVAQLSHGQFGVVSDPPDPTRHGVHLRELAARHGLAGWLERWLPADYPELPTIRLIAGLASLRSMEACVALIDLHAAFDSAGIRYLQFKGPSTALRFHGDIRKRPFSDLDIFVPAERLWEAASVAEEVGFLLDDRLRKEHVRRASPRHLSHIRGPIQLELHRRLSDYEGMNGSFEGFWNRRNHVCLSGQKIPCLGLADTFYHSSLHGTEHAFLSLKWLADLALMSIDRQDVEDALRLSKEAGMEPAFLCGHALLADVGGAISNPLRSPLEARSRRLNRLVVRSWKTIFQVFGEPWLSIHRIWMLRPLDRVRAVASLVLTPGSRDWDIAPWLPPDTPLVFQAIRICRLALKLGRLSVLRALSLISTKHRSLPV